MSLGSKVNQNMLLNKLINTMKNNTKSINNIGTSLNSNFTSMGWQRKATSASAEILSYSQTYYRLSFDIVDSGMYFYQREQASPNTTRVTGVSVSNLLNVWNHFALVRNGNDWSFYKNGTVVGTNTFVPTETLSGTAYHIGGAWMDDDYLSNCMEGDVGPTMHYIRALSSPEILQNYNATKTRFGL